MTPKEKQQSLVEEMGMDPDDAAHMLADMGEINSTEHAELLSEKERERIYP